MGAIDILDSQLFRSPGLAIRDVNIQFAFQVLLDLFGSVRLPLHELVLDSVGDKGLGNLLMRHMDNAETSVLVIVLSDRKAMSILEIDSVQGPGTICVFAFDLVTSVGGFRRLEFDILLDSIGSACGDEFLFGLENGSLEESFFLGVHHTNLG